MIKVALWPGGILWKTRAVSCMNVDSWGNKVHVPVLGNKTAEVKALYSCHTGWCDWLFELFLLSEALKSWYQCSQLNWASTGTNAACVPLYSTLKATACNVSLSAKSTYIRPPFYYFLLLSCFFKYSWRDEISALTNFCLQQFCMWSMFFVLGAKPKHQAKAVTKSPMTKAPQRSDATKTSRWV